MVLHESAGRMWFDTGVRAHVSAQEASVCRSRESGDDTTGGYVADMRTAMQLVAHCTVPADTCADWQQTRSATETCQLVHMAAYDY